MIGAYGVGLEALLDTTLSHEAFKSSVFYAEPMIAAQWRFVDAWRVHASIGTATTGALGSPNVRGVLAFEWAPMP